MMAAGLRLLRLLLQVGNLVEVHNQDARDFLRSQAQPAAIAALLQKRMQAGETPSKAEGAIEQKRNNQQSADEVHVLMNLPELAIEFLGESFKSLYLSPILHGLERCCCSAFFARVSVHLTI